MWSFVSPELSFHLTEGEWQVGRTISLKTADEKLKNIAIKSASISALHAKLIVVAPENFEDGSTLSIMCMGRAGVSE